MVYTSFTNRLTCLTPIYIIFLLSQFAVLLKKKRNKLKASFHASILVLHILHRLELIGDGFDSFFKSFGYEYFLLRINSGSCVFDSKGDDESLTPESSVQHIAIFNINMIVFNTSFTECLCQSITYLCIFYTVSFMSKYAYFVMVFKFII